MALATDANISRLQQMFPTVEGDVIAIVLNDCGNNVEQCINHLLEMSEENTSHAGPSHHDVVQQDNWPSVSQSSTKKPQHNKRPPRKRSPVPPSRNPGGPGNRPPGGNSSFQEGNGKRVGSPQKEMKERQNMTNPGVGVAKKHLLVTPPPPRGPGVPPAGNIPPRPPHNQAPPNWQYYSGGRPTYPQSMYGGAVYGVGADQKHKLQPRIIAPPGGIPRGPRGGAVFRPNGQFGPSGPPRGIIPIGPNGAPLVHGGMVLRTSVMRPPGGIPINMPVRPGGMALAYNGRPFVPSGTPPTSEPQTTTNVTNKQNQTVTTLPLNLTQTVVNNNGTRTSVSDSHSPEPHGTGWPVEIESETGTEYLSTAHDDVETGGDSIGDSRMLEKAGREWLSWTKNNGPTPTEKKLILLRGLPGSGKSTLAREIAGKNGVICSTDDFFYNDGRYIFDASKLGEYHDLNKEKAREAMLIENSPVVIDNTNTSAWEMKPYVDIARSMGYTVEIVEPTTPWRFNPSELARRNSHGVPQDKIEKMLERYQHGVTVDSILASSRKPTRERASHSFSRRRENNGRGGHVTSHMTPAHPHYARRLCPSQSHKQQETSKPTSSSSSHFSPTELTSTSGTLKASQAPASNVSLSSYSSNGQICSSHSSPNIASPASAGSSHVTPNLGLPHPSLNTAPSHTAPNIGLSHTVPSSHPSTLPSTHAAPDVGSHSSTNIGLSPNTATSGAAPNLKSSFSPHKLGPTSISSSAEQTHSTGKYSIPITSSHSLPNLGKRADSGGGSGRNDAAPFLSPPLPPTPQLRMSKHPPDNFNSLHSQRAGNKSNTAQSVTISPSGAPGSTGDPLSPSPSNLTKEEEEERAAKMSKIWGDGKLSDDTEAHLDRETRTVWGEGVWGAGLSRPVPGGKGATRANLSWGRFGSGSGSNGLVWSGSERVVGEAVSDPVEMNGLVGHPLPCEFGPIGKQTKRKQDTKTDDNGTTKTKTATNGTTLVGNPPDTKENGKVKKNRASSNGGHSHDKVSDTGRGRPLSHSTRHRSSSTELWVSAETETWPYEEPSEDVFHEEKREESVENVAPTAPSLPSHTHKNKSHLSDRSKSPNPSTCEQSPSMADDTSFEDPAIINMVRQSPLPLEGGAHLQEDIELEPENQEPLFAPPSSETSPEQQKTRPLPSSERLSLLLSPPSHQPAPANPHLITHTTNTDFNGVPAPTDAYFSGGATSLSRREDTAHSSTNTATDTLQCSTPTLIPADEEEEEELVIEGGRDYFPSAFETDRQTLAPGFCLNESGEVPNSDVTITSSFEAGVVPSSLPINCVSTPPAESGNCKVRRSLWSSGEKSGKEGEGLVPLEGSPHSSVQETSGESVSYRIGSSSGAAEEGHTEEVSPSTKEAPNAQSDLAFLEECFPDLSRPFLKKLLLQSDGNVEEAVSTALVSSVVSPTQPPVGAGDILFNWSSLAVDPFYYAGGLEYWGLGSAFNDRSSAASMTSESEVEGGGGGEEVWASDGDDECMDDREIARLIQEELDLEASSEEPSLEKLWKFAAGETERRGTEEEDDENLVLRLSRSLASQLQQMFGSVDKHLPVEGELRDEDLKVLLSERAARQIWQKWIDTLEAKKVEILLNQASRAKSVPGTLAASPDSRPPERSGTEPERLTNIMDEQSAQQTSAKQVRRVVKAACSKNMARTMRLRQLYRQFRSLSKDTIEYVLFKNSFNFSSAAAELEREKAREEGVDGNAASQSGLTSFAGTAGKTTTGAAGPSDKPRAALLQLPTRSPSRRRRRPANKTKQPTRNKEVPIQSLGGLKDAPAYDDLRAEAALHAKLRSEAFQKAARARGLKQGEVAVYYAQKGHSHTEKMKEANSRAAALILHLHNDLSSQFLDLHGLYVDEALAALEDKLQSTTDQAVLYVITGKGLHSKGDARIKPAVIGYLNSKAYRFEELQGKLKVKLA